MSQPQARSESRARTTRSCSTARDGQTDGRTTTTRKPRRCIRGENWMFMLLDDVANARTWRPSSRSCWCCAARRGSCCSAPPNSRCTQLLSRSVRARSTSLLCVKRPLVLVVHPFLPFRLCASLTASWSSWPPCAWKAFSRTDGRVFVFEKLKECPS